MKTPKKYVLLLLLISTGLFFTSCGGDEKPSDNTSKKAPTSMLAKKSANKTDAKNDKGIGPIKEVTLGEIDPKLVEQGKTIYDAKCTACHKPYKKYIGPAPAGLIERRTPEWIMNMILNPEEMVKKDPIAMKLFEEYLFVPMANQNLTEDEARAVLEYIRTLKASDKK